MAESAVSEPAGTQAGLYTRNATGLVRTAGLTDTVFFNWISGGAIGLALVYNVYWILNGFPGVDIVQSTLVTLVFALCAVLVFALLAAAIPRSGGDYVFVSRILHPLWGFVSSWTNFISVAAYAGWVAWFCAVAFISGSASVLAQVSGITALGDFGTWAATPTGALVLGTIVLLFAAVSMAAGLQFSLRVITVLAIVGLIGLVLSAIVFLLNDHAAFVAKFNEFAGSALGSDPYNAMVALGAKNGFTPAPQGSADFASATLPAAVVAFYATGYTVWSIYIAGEVKGSGSRNRQLAAMAIPMVLNVLVLIGMVVLMFRTVGYDFLSSASYVYNYAPANYPLGVPPFVNFFASLLSGNAILNVIIGISWIVWPVAMALLIMVGYSRLLFAWSFDGVLPRALADVNERTHSPLKAVVVSFVAAWIGLWLTINVTQFLTFLAFSLLLSLVFWFSVAIAGALLPFRLPKVFEASPARRRIGGIPVITIAGLVLALWVLAEFYWALTVPGLFIPNAGEGILVTGGVMAVGAVIFIASWYVRKSRGFDPNYVYREIPPE